MAFKQQEVQEDIFFMNKQIGRTSYLFVLIVLSLAFLVYIMFMVITVDDLLKQDILFIIVILIPCLLLLTLIISGIIYWDFKTNITLDKNGIFVQYAYLGRFKGKSLNFLFSDILRLYSNQSSDFPYFFLVYIQNGKKKIIGIDKSGIDKYSEFLAKLEEKVTIINERKWIYSEVKNEEFK